MVEFALKINRGQKVMYIPKEIINTLGFEWKAIPNSAALVAFARDADLRTVEKSVEIILADLSLRLEKEGPKQG